MFSGLLWLSAGIFRIRIGGLRRDIKGLLESVSNFLEATIIDHLFSRLLKSSSHEASSLNALSSCSLHAETMDLLAVMMYRTSSNMSMKEPRFLQN